MNLKRAIGGPLLSFVFLIFFAYAIFGFQWIFKNYFHEQFKEEFLGSASTSVQDITDVVRQTPASTPELEISANSAILIETDLQNQKKVLFQKNSEVKLPIASLTKLMTAVVVLDNYNLTDTIVVDAAANSQDPMKQDVKLGDVMSVKNFLDIMLIGSSNKSAYVLAELVGEQNFVGLMNKKAKDLGLQNTFFVDPTGLSPDNASTAGDLAKLTEHILKNYPEIANISRLKEIYVPKFGNVVNTNQLLDEIPDVICSKTGFTTEAKGCLILVVGNPKNNNNYLISVILGAEDRFAEMKKIINWSSEICK